MSKHSQGDAMYTSSSRSEMFRCPIATCERCDAERREEQDERCRARREAKVRGADGPYRPSVVRWYLDCVLFMVEVSLGVGAVVFAGTSLPIAFQWRCAAFVIAALSAESAAVTLKRIAET